MNTVVYQIVERIPSVYRTVHGGSPAEDFPEILLSRHVRFVESCRREGAMPRCTRNVPVPHASCCSTSRPERRGP